MLTRFWSVGLWICAVPFIASTVSLAAPPNQDDRTNANNGSALPKVFAEDLQHTPTYAYVVAAMSPYRMSQLPGVKANPLADLTGPIAIKPSEVDRVVAVLFPRQQSEEGLHLGAAFVIKLRTDIAREAIAAWLSPNAKPHPSNDRIFMAADQRRGDYVLGFVTDRTIVISSDPGYVFSQFWKSSDKTPPHALAPALAQVSPDAQAYVVGDFDKLNHFVAAASMGDESSFTQMMGPLAESHAVQFSVRLDKPDGIMLQVAFKDPKDAKAKGNNLVDLFKEHGHDSLAFFQESLGSDSAANIQTVDARLKRLLADLRVENDQTSATIKSQQLAPPAELLGLVHDFGGLHIATLKSNLNELRFVSNLRNVTLGIHNYLDTYTKLPQDIVSKDGTPLLSWRVAILPFIESQAISDQFHLDEAWDSPHNRKLLAQMPSCYRSRGGQDSTKTPFQRVTGKNTTGSAKLFADIKNPGKTLFVIESDQLIEWTRPGDFVFDPQAPSKNIRRRGSIAAAGDGSILHLKRELDAQVLRAAFTNGGDYDINLLQRSRSGDVDSRASFSRRLLTDLQNALRANGEFALADTLAIPSGGIVTRNLPQVFLNNVADCLGSKSPLVRLRAIQLFVEIRPGNAIEWKRMATMLDDRYEANRWLAMRFLADYPEPELVQRFLRVPASDLNTAGMLLYRKLAPIAADGAVPLLKDSDLELRRRAIMWISTLGSDKHLPKLEQLAQGEEETCREFAKSAIGQLTKKGPLERALEAANGNITLASKSVFRNATDDQDGNLVSLELDQHHSPERFRSRDFRLLSQLRKLQSVDVTESDITSEDVATWTDLPLVELEIDYCNRVGDVVADSLRKMTRLRRLDVGRTNVGDKTAQAIGGLSGLVFLDVAATRISNEGLSHLAGLKNLQSLNLSGTRITDGGVKFIAQLKNLRELFLLETDLTDASIEQLGTLTNLTFINLSSSHVTAEGLARLQAALPNCRGIK